MGLLCLFLGMVFYVSWLRTHFVLWYLTVHLVQSALFWAICMQLLWVATWAIGSCCSRYNVGSTGRTCAKRLKHFCVSVLFVSKTNILHKNPWVYYILQKIHVGRFHMLLWISQQPYHVVHVAMMLFLVSQTGSHVCAGL